MHRDNSRRIDFLSKLMAVYVYNEKRNMLHLFTETQEIFICLKYKSMIRVQLKNLR